MEAGQGVKSNGGGGSQGSHSDLRQMWQHAVDMSSISSSDILCEPLANSEVSHGGGIRKGVSTVEVALPVSQSMCSGWSIVGNLKPDEPHKHGAGPRCG
jgi:hypothetical protein